VCKYSGGDAKHVNAIIAFAICYSGIPPDATRLSLLVVNRDDVRWNFQWQKNEISRNFTSQLLQQSL